MPWSYVAFVLLTLFLTALLGFATYRTARLLRDWRPQGNPLLDPMDFGLRLLLCFVCVGLGFLSGASYEQLGWAAAQPWRDIGLGVVLGLLLAGAVNVSTRWIVARTGDRYYSSLVVDLMAPRDGREMALVAVALAPGVLLEELLFRSLWIGGLGMVAPAWALVLCAGLIFGVLHSPQGAWGMVGAALAGILFGALFLLSGSLLLPLAVHYVVNVVQLGFARRRALPEAS